MKKEKSLFYVGMKKLLGFIDKTMPGVFLALALLSFFFGDKPGSLGAPFFMLGCSVAYSLWNVCSETIRIRGKFTLKGEDITYVMDKRKN